MKLRGAYNIMINNLSELQKKDLKYVFHPCTQMKDFEENPA